MEQPKLISNITERVVDDLRQRLSEQSRISIAAASFSIYAYEALKTELEEIDELRFIFTSPTFIKDKAKKEKREFYIIKLNRERNLYGTDFEIRLRNQLSQKAIAKECVEWIRRKVKFLEDISEDVLPNERTGFKNSVIWNKLYNFSDIAEQLNSLNLSIYTPSLYLFDSAKGTYSIDYEGEGLSIDGREKGLRKLMATNLLKRLESSVNSFRLTLTRISEYIRDTKDEIDVLIATDCISEGQNLQDCDYLINSPKARQLPYAEKSQGLMISS